MNQINLLYSYIHNDLNEDYEIYPIIIDKIKTSDIELLGKNIYIDEIIKQKMQFLFNIDDDIYLRIITDNIPSLIKLSLSKKSYNDNYISYILSELVLLKKTKHILLPIFNSDVEINRIRNILESIDLPNIYNNFLEKNKNIKINFKLRECFYNISTLRKYIIDLSLVLNDVNDSEPVCKSVVKCPNDLYRCINYRLLLFKIIHTLLVIKNKYKYFTHNNLTLCNIFVYINKEIVSNDYEIYKFNGETYYLPYEIYEIKITNFEDSSIKPLDTKTSSDLATLANDILKLNKNIDLCSKNFLTKLRDMKNNNIENLLNDEYFNELKQKKSKSFNGIRNIGALEDDNSVIVRKENKSESNRKIINESQYSLDSDYESILGQQTKINRHHVKNMVGGNDKPSVAPYKSEKNDPFRTNDQRNTFKKAEDDKQPVKTPPVILEQKVYDVSKQTQPKPELPPAYVPLYNTAGESIAVPFTHIPNPGYNKPMQKVYNISLANPLHDFTTISRVYEDIIPGDPRSFSFTTTYERTQLINFMRNLINNNIDGESMNVTGGKNSLLSSIKLLKLNPYSLDKNPYLDLGSNFLIYNAAYPIRYDETKDNIFISKNAHGVNVRLYPLTYGEAQGSKLKADIDNFDYDLWREIKFYNHIRDEIIKKKLSPNFIAPILRKEDELSNIHWSKLAEIQKKRVEDIKKTKQFIFLDDTKLEIYILEKINDSSFNTHISSIELILEPYKKNITINKLNFSHPDYIPISNKYKISSYPFIIFKYNGKYDPYPGEMNSDDIVGYIKKNILSLEAINIKVNTGKSVILLTEAPTNNFISWASPTYQTSGSLKKMIATGFHKKEVWESVLFQLMHILYILQKEEIYFDELSLKNNIYIKDLYYEPNTTNYWIYKIDDLEYYVPNYGYLVLFDSKYADVESGDYKIKSSKLFPANNDKINKDKKKTDDTAVILPDIAFDFKKLIYNKFKDLFNRDTLNTELKLQGGLPPDEDILSLISSINNHTDENIENYFYTYFRKFLNNRVGTFLMKTEKELINLTNRPLFNKGELLIKMDRYGEYKWVIFKQDVNKIVKKIINKDNNNNIIEEDVNQFSLIKYPLGEGITPNNITESNIIEQFR